MHISKCENDIEEAARLSCEADNDEALSEVEKRIICFEDTFKKSNSGSLAELTLRAINSNRVYKEKFISDIERSNENAVVEVCSGTTFDVAKKYRAFGKTAVLNFANPEIAGGGVKLGAMAQEACLCRSSNLYSCISAQNVFDEYYNYHRNFQSALSTDRLIYTKNVTVFKDDSEIPQIMAESEWFGVDVITCAAPCLVKIKNVIDVVDLLSLLESRIRNIFEAARDNDIDYLILGAFGCGAFGNPPFVVAEAFCRIIEECGYLKCFKGIIFAIKPNSPKLEKSFLNLDAFEACFSDYSNKATDYTGRVINGRYELIRILGKSTSFVTYLAKDLKLEKYWAVKVCCKSAWNYSLKLRAILLHEPDMIMNLTHSAIPKIADIIENNEIVCVIREYAEGETLENIVKNFGAQPADTVVPWVLQICDALEYLHSQTPAYIYRDMKPANVVLMPNGKIKIIDFGIMRIYKPHQKGDTENLGTKGYAAPEQYCGGNQTDARTDVYAIGMTLYRLLTGEEPEKAFDMTLGKRIACFKMHKGLVYIISKCIRKNPEERYQSCGELMKDLENYRNLSKSTSRLKMCFFGW